MNTRTATRLLPPPRLFLRGHELATRTTPDIDDDHLVKTFGQTRALDGLNLTIRGGSVYGLLGPNGAGKTTAIRVLATLLQPSAGTATVLGHDVVRDAALARQKVSLTGQYASVDEDLTGQAGKI